MQNNKPANMGKQLLVAHKIGLLKPFMILLWVRLWPRSWWLNCWVVFWLMGQRASCSRAQWQLAMFSFLMYLFQLMGPAATLGQFTTLSASVWQNGFKNWCKANLKKILIMETAVDVEGQHWKLNQLILVMKMIKRFYMIYFIWSET